MKIKFWFYSSISACGTEAGENYVDLQCLLSMIKIITWHAHGNLQWSYLNTTKHHFLLKVYHMFSWFIHIYSAAKEHAAIFQMSPLILLWSMGYGCHRIIES